MPSGGKPGGVLTRTLALNDRLLVLQIVRRSALAG
jgi:hypothetical protein